MNIPQPKETPWWHVALWVGAMVALALWAVFFTGGCATSPRGVGVVYATNTPVTVQPPVFSSPAQPSVIMPIPKGVEAVSTGATMIPLVVGVPTPLVTNILIIPISTVPTNGATVSLLFSTDRKNWTTLGSNIYVGGPPGTVMFTNRTTNVSGYYRTKRTS